MSKQARNHPRSINIFITFADEDRPFLVELKQHLRVMEQEQLIQVWDASQMHAGSDWDSSIRMHMDTANVILLLISADFLASQSAFEQMERALIKSQTGTSVVIPVAIRPVDWMGTPFAQLQPLPKEGRFITDSRNRDRAWLEVVSEIRRVCEELLSDDIPLSSPELHSNGPENFVTAPKIHKFHNIFVKSGFPRVTYVEHKSLKKLKYAIDTPGRGVVIEGPSGIGKTTAVEKVMEELGMGKMIYLSARNQRDVQRIQTLEDWHQGTVIIDDFHHLEIPLRQQIVNYLKYLADTSKGKTKKVVIIGIPHTHQKLVHLAFDLATRIDVFNLAKVDDTTIQKMIEKGEEALNVRFEHKYEIIRAANGSLNIAQYICWNICLAEDVLSTSPEMQRVRCNVEVAVAEVMDELSMKFGETLRYFAELGGPKNATTLRLLEELARCEDGFLPLLSLKNKRSELASGIERFINEHWLEELYQKHPESAMQLFFDRMGTALVADDPQLIFYLNYFARTGMAQLAREVGKTASLAQRKVFISYSHQDTEWLKRLQVHLRPLEQEGIIDLWDDTKIKAGAIWQDRIQEALETARVALVLVSADFLASSFIAEHELPDLLSRAVSGGTTIIPVILSPCLFTRSGLKVFQTINPPSKPLSSLDRNGQEQIFMQLAEAVSERLENEEA